MFPASALNGIELWKNAKGRCCLLRFGIKDVCNVQISLNEVASTSTKSLLIIDGKKMSAILIPLGIEPQRSELNIMAKLKELP